MIRPALALIAAALLTTSAVAAPKPAAHKPGSAKPAAAAPAPAAALPTGPFDARDPANMSALLTSIGATVQAGPHDKGAVLLKVSSPAGGFTVQYDGCNQQGRLCAAVLFDAAAEAKTATIAEINAFNLSSLACRIVQDRSNKPHVLYSALVFASTSRQDAGMQVNAWRGCLSDFAAFLKDPPGYLAAAP